MNVAIKGHPKRGNKVIEILEMLGGKNIHRIDAIRDYCVYFVMDDKNKTISSLKLNQVLPEQFIIYSLEEFLEKFPYKVGDKVIDIKTNRIVEIYKAHWSESNNCTYYDVKHLNNTGCVRSYKFLQPYKKETMEDKLEQITFDIPDGYEFFGINDDNQVVLAKKKPQYPKTYEECCKVLGCDRNLILGTMPMKYQVLINFQKLLICRDAYWKIAGEQMGLGKSWEPDFGNDLLKYYISFHNNKIDKGVINYSNKILAFPTEEMRDTFYNNFKELINEVKELL